MASVFLVKTSSMGDVIHNLPVASDLCTAYPGSEIRAFLGELSRETDNAVIDTHVSQASDDSRFTIYDSRNGIVSRFTFHVSRDA